jgi:hypothetical protein
MESKLNHDKRETPTSDERSLHSSKYYEFLKRQLIERLQNVQVSHHILFDKMICIAFPVRSGPYFMGYPWTPKSIARARDALPLYVLRAATPEM